MVVVTGADDGIGREYAIQLAAHGAKVVVNNLGTSVRRAVDTVSAASGQAVANGEDVSTWDGARRLIEHAVSHFGRLNCLVNNAGILRDRMMVSMDEADEAIHPRPQPRSSPHAL